MESASNKDENIESLIQQIRIACNTNYEKVSPFLEEYHLHELDYVRHEIRICLLLNLNQAAITLINHLLEKFLKVILVYTQRNDKSYNNIEILEKEFGITIKNFGSQELGKTISACKSKNIISKPEAEILENFRIGFRNAYSHSDFQKIFKDEQETIVYGNMITGDFTKHTVKITNFPFLQGKMQKELADKQALGYFASVDTIIRKTIRKYFKID